jgi:hypothetical protein
MYKCINVTIQLGPSGPFFILNANEFKVKVKSILYINLNETAQFSSPCSLFCYVSNYK